jgi:hypothetical protein
VIKHCNYHTYADDLQLYMHTKLNSLNESISAVNKDLKEILSYANKNLLFLNTTKTQQLLICPSKMKIEKIKSECLPIQIGNNPIPFVREAKNLGVIFNEKLDWKDQVNSTSKRCFMGMKILYRNKKFIPSNLKLCLIKTLIYPLIDYCNVVLTDVTVQENNKLQRIQNACIRFVAGAKKYDHLTAHFKGMKELNVTNRRDKHALCIIYKIIKTPMYVPIYLQNLVKRLRSSTNRLTCSEFTSQHFIPLHRTSKCSRSFKIKYAKVWNNIPKVIRDSNSLNIFKKAIENYLISGQFN